MGRRCLRTLRRGIDTSTRASRTPTNRGTQQLPMRAIQVDSIGEVRGCMSSRMGRRRRGDEGLHRDGAGMGLQSINTLPSIYVREVAIDKSIPRTSNWRRS